MKPVFGTDITTDRRNDWKNQDELITREVGEALKAKLAGAIDLTETVEKKSDLAWYGAIAQGLFGAAAILGFFATLNYGLDHGFSGLLKNARPWPYVFAAGGIAWLALHLVSRLKKRKTVVSGEAAAADDALKGAIKQAREELGVPENAEAVDILMLDYKVKNGKPVNATPPYYLNPELHAYRQNDALVLWGGSQIWAFPLSEMKRIRTVKKTNTAMLWNKDEKPRSGRFAQYKLVVNNYGVSAKTYHILELERGGETYGIYFPCWELPVFERLTGLNAEEAQKE